MSVLPDDAVVVADRTTAGKILCSPTKCVAFGYLVSIGGPTEREPAGLKNVRNRIRLVFEDATTQQDGGPSIQDIQALVRFAQTVNLTKGKLLVQCQAGIGRSSAAAMIVVASALGTGHEGQAVEYVRRTHPHVRPNKRMLELADEVMRADGRLVRAAGGA